MTTSFNRAHEAYVPDNIVDRSDGVYQTELVTILDGETIVAGEVLGKVTASGKYIASLSAAGDGSEVPDAIALEASSPSGADGQCVVLKGGRVNENALTVGTAHTLASIEEGLRAKGIRFAKSMPRV